MTYLITLEEWFAISASISNFNRHFWMKKSFCKYMRKTRFHQALNWRCPGKIFHLCIQLAWLWLNFVHSRQHFYRKTGAFPTSAGFLKQKTHFPLCKSFFAFVLFPATCPSSACSVSFSTVEGKGRANQEPRYLGLREIPTQWFQR